jgi:Insertion element 4 transposase N-terminal
VIEETGAGEKRLRLLPSRVMVYFVLALSLFENCQSPESVEDFLMLLGPPDAPASWPR